MTGRAKKLGTIKFAEDLVTDDPLLNETQRLSKILTKFSFEALKRGATFSAVISAHLNAITDVDELMRLKGVTSSLPQALRDLADKIESGEMRLRRTPPEGRA